ncbi:Lactoylglutathione lyase [Pseudolycoriella hygida]|uniref:Lactoylglutathione lyase n=1 Tax=Pseudolycoriella hygida TaxID=35572 RepID=A0A9Q0NEZ8_9DIPT|nr:Lactoylglutathione lyase [Pseudolycoriella hygida]
MHRIREPAVSLSFYTEALGLTLLDSATLAMDTESQFTMFFLAYEGNIPIDEEERRMWAMSYPGAINLQYIWSGDVAHHEYDDEMALPTGYSHIGIFATDVYEFCDSLTKFNVTFIKKPNEGVVLGNAFILDPDGYWIEIMNPYKMSSA